MMKTNLLTIVTFRPTVLCQAMFGVSLLTMAHAHANHHITPQTTLDVTTVITATKTEKGLLETPIPVIVLDKKTLSENHARTLKQAIELLPNVSLKQLHGKTGYEVIMQGFGGDQVLVLIDGLPLTASTGSTVNLNQYLNTEVEQVEVIQGASSAQYGSSAMGGVINVITKKIDTKGQRFTGNVVVEMGSNGSQNPSGKKVDANMQHLHANVDMQLDKAGKWQARVNASHHDDKGLSLNPNEWAKLKDGSKQAQITGKLLYQPTPKDNQRQVWLEATHYQETDDSRYLRRIAQNMTQQLREEMIDKQRYATGFRYQLDKNNTLLPVTGGTLQGSLMYETYHSDSHQFNVYENQRKVQSLVRETDIDTSIAQLQYDLPEIQFGKHSHLLQVGGKWQQDSLSQLKDGANELVFDNAKRDVGEIYLQDDWLIGNAEVVTGVRYQNDSDFGGYTAPKVAVKYDHVDSHGYRHIWRASVGQGYRVPNLKERYYLFDHSHLGYKVMGNPDLEPENSTSYQVGYQAKFGDKLSLAINGFYNDVSNLIQIDSDNATYDGNIAIYRYVNVADAKTYGGDINATWQLNDKHQLQANYTHTKTHNKQTNTELTERPKHKAMLTLNQQLTDKLQLIHRLNYEGKHLVSTATQGYSPSWTTVDSKVNYQLNSNIGLYAGINNIFNTQRKPNDANDQRPIDNRQWLIGATFHF